MTRARTALAAALLQASTLLLGAPATAAEAAAEAPRATAPGCTTTGGAYAPRTLAVPGVLPAVAVLGRGRDRDGVPQPPPLTDRGRWQLAWDRASGTRPGDPAGVVRLTAHTYPRGSAGDAPPALGNLLLDRLRVGATVRVAGAGDRLTCYRVTRRQRVRAEDALGSGYYDTGGAPRLAILVCSGVRRGPGDWSHRTIWWARPTAFPEPTRSPR